MEEHGGALLGSIPATSHSGAPSFAFFAKGGIRQSRSSKSGNSRHNGVPGPRL
jgi:hypothetical protein